MDRYSARIYEPDSAEARAVSLRMTNQGLFIDDANVAVPFQDLDLEVGGHEEDRIKITSKSSGMAIISENRDLINALCDAAPGTHIGKQAQTALAKIQALPGVRRKYWTIVISVVALVAVLAYLSIDVVVACAVDHIDPSVEEKIGEICAPKDRLDSTSAQAKRVAEIGNTLVAQMKDNRYHFHFFVKHDNTINACAYPGGTLVVNSGLLKQASDDELAGVMGHEIGHVIHRDTLRAALHSAGLLVCIGVITGAGGQNADKIASALSLAQRLESLQFSRSQESNADAIGLELAVKAHYKGEALITFFTRLEKEEGEAGNNRYLALVSDHPMTQDRIDAIRAKLQRMKTSPQ